MNGLVGFQAWEDGTPRSLWLLRISCLVVWAVCFFVSIATFKSWASFTYTRPLGLFVTYLVFPLVCVVFYIVSQLVLVIRTLDDRWVIGDLIFGIAFYAVGVVLLVAFSNTICSAVSHYIDGVFFFTLCMLLTVMMVYKVSTVPLIKDIGGRWGHQAGAIGRSCTRRVDVNEQYWDSITKEDLEFSVGSKQAVWEVKEPLNQVRIIFYRPFALLSAVVPALPSLLFPTPHPTKLHAPRSVSLPVHITDSCQAGAHTNHTGQPRNVRRRHHISLPRRRRLAHGRLRIELLCQLPCATRSDPGSGSGPGPAATYTGGAGAVLCAVESAGAAAVRAALLVDRARRV